ncbi:MAG: hypothetical protein E6344_15255 [Clostridium sp.]|nr:hypothetical protein [Clostridium sp.]MDU7085051.1 hypothetical protein [Clostridium sp.]
MKGIRQDIYPFSIARITAYLTSIVEKAEILNGIMLNRISYGK